MKLGGKQRIGAGIALASAVCAALVGLVYYAGWWSRHPGPASTGAASLGIGGDLSCSLMRDSSLWCWGGIPGPGYVSTGRLRALIAEVSPTELAIDSPGGGCATVGAGELRCWDSTPQGTYAFRSGLPEGQGYRHLVAGPSAACVQSGQGQALCWGSGYWEAPFGTTATRVPELDGAAHVALRGSQVCGRRENGSVLCMDPKLFIEPPGRQGIPGVWREIHVDAEEISVGSFACALTKAHVVACWNPGEVVPKTIEGTAGATCLSANADRACACLGAGGIVCWNARGDRLLEVANLRAEAIYLAWPSICAGEAAGTLRCWSVPYVAEGMPPAAASGGLRVPGLSGVESVTMADGLLCARSNGKWECHALENPEADAEGSVNPPRPRVVREIPDSIGVSQSRFALCSRDSRHTLTCSQTVDDSGNLAPLSVRHPVEHIREVDVGADHACAVREDGVLLCWGANETGQVTIAQPSVVAEPVVVLDDVAKVAVGDRHTCAIRVDSTVQCWGDNSHGQLGVPPDMEPHEARRVGAVVGARQAAAGSTHSCALDAQGQVWCWGSNEAGQCGVDSAGPHGSPTRVNGIDGTVVQLAAGLRSTCALMKAGPAKCWGQLTSRLERHSASTAVEGTSGAVELAMGNEHACVRFDSGEVRCWGSNAQGQLGADLPFRTLPGGPHATAPAGKARETSTERALPVPW